MSDAPICRQFKAITFEQIEFRGSGWNPAREDFRIGYAACGPDCSVRLTGTQGSWYIEDSYDVPEGQLVVVDGNTATIPISSTVEKEPA